MTCPPSHPCPAPPAQDRPGPPLPRPGPPLPPPSAELPAHPAVDIEPPVPGEGDAARGVFSDLLLRFKTKQGKKKQTVPIVLLVLFVRGRGGLAVPAPSPPPTAHLGQRGGWGGDTSNWGWSLREPLDLGVFQQKKGRCRRPTLLCHPLRGTRRSPLEVVPRAHWWSWGPLPPSLMSRR